MLLTLAAVVGEVFANGGSLIATKHDPTASSHAARAASDGDGEGDGAEDEEVGGDAKEVVVVFAVWERVMAAAIMCRDGGSIL